MFYISQIKSTKLEKVTQAGSALTLRVMTELN